MRAVSPGGRERSRGGERERGREVEGKRRAVVELGFVKRERDAKGRRQGWGR